MIDLEKLEFLNLAKYFSQMKVAVELLYRDSEIVFTKTAKDDLERISLKGLAKTFSLGELEEWQLGNELLGITCFVDYLNFQLLTMNEAVDHQLAGQSESYIPSVNKAYTYDELRIVKAAISHWDSFSNLFFMRIEHPDTVKIILKNAEMQRAKSLGLVSTGDETDISAFYCEKIARVCDLLRQKLHDLNNIDAPLSGMPIDGRLPTTIPLEQWQTILRDLVERRYLPRDYLENPSLIAQWVHFAFVPDDGNTEGGSREKLRWIANQISAAQFIMTLKKVEGIVSSDSDNTRLYQWVKRVIDYPGEDEIMQKDLRRVLKYKTQCFEVTRDSSQQIVFKIRQTARKRKGSQLK